MLLANHHFSRLIKRKIRYPHARYHLLVPHKAALTQIDVTRAQTLKKIYQLPKYLHTVRPSADVEHRASCSFCLSPLSLSLFPILGWLFFHPWARANAMTSHGVYISQCDWEFATIYPMRSCQVTRMYSQRTHLMQRLVFQSEQSVFLKYLCLFLCPQQSSFVS